MLSSFPKRGGGRQHASCDIDTGCVAFCWTENISAPDLSYAAQYLACALPCERFTAALAGSPCITRGRCGSLLLHRDGLPPSTSCRSPGAPVHPIIPDDLANGASGPTLFAQAPSCAARIRPEATHALTSELGHSVGPINASQKHDSWRRFLRLWLVGSAFSAMNPRRPTT